MGQRGSYCGVFFNLMRLAWTLSNKAILVLHRVNIQDLYMLGLGFAPGIKSSKVRTIGLSMASGTSERT